MKGTQLKLQNTKKSQGIKTNELLTLELAAAQRIGIEIPKYRGTLIETQKETIRKKTRDKLDKMKTTHPELLERKKRRSQIEK